MKHFSLESIKMILLPIVADGLASVCLARLLQREQAYALAAVEIPYTPVRWITTYAEGLRNLESLLVSALRTICICAFAFHLNRVMPSGRTLASVLNSKAAEGVEVKIMINSTGEYSNLSPKETRDQLHPRVQLYACRSPSHELNIPFVAQIGYSFAHVKMCCVDGARMQIGTVDVDPWERLGYNVVNKNGFAWHETALQFNCSNETLAWVEGLFQEGSFNICRDPPPLPLVCGGQHEAHVMCRMIDTAQSSVYIEHQIVSMGPTEDMSVQLILEALARKIAFVHDFKVVILTNAQQDDEYTWFSRHFSSMSLLSTIRHMATLVKRMNPGLDDEVCSKNVRYLTLTCSSGEPMKTHSNVMIVDTALAIRSSSNLTSRSLGASPCDMELGIVIMDGVEDLLHRLLRLHCPLMNMPSIQGFLDMVDSGQSHAKPVVLPKLPQLMIDVFMSVSHLHPSSGHCNGRMQFWKMQ